MSLSSRTMYVSLSQRIWQASAMDRGLAATVEHDTEAQNRTMKVLKQLAPSDYLLPIKRIAKYGKDQHARLTLPGMQEGTQLLATRLFDEYALIQSEIKDSFYQEVNRFADLYPIILEMAPKRLGKAFNERDFPVPEKIKSFFDYEIRFSPVPDTGNWLLDDVDELQLSELRNDIENQKNVMYREAAKTLYERADAILDNLSKQASAYEDGRSNGSALRDPTIKAVQDMAELITSMNITADPVLDQVGVEMREKFSKLDAKELRNSSEERQRVNAIAERLRAKLSGSVL